MTDLANEYRAWVDTAVKEPKKRLVIYRAIEAYRQVSRAKVVTAGQIEPLMVAAKPLYQSLGVGNTLLVLLGATTPGSEGRDA